MTLSHHGTRAGDRGHGQAALLTAIVGYVVWAFGAPSALARGTPDQVRAGSPTVAQGGGWRAPPSRRSAWPRGGSPRRCLRSRAPAHRHIGAMPQAGIRAHSGTVQRLVGPVDLARFDSTVKVPTEGSGRTSRHPGRRVPVRSLCDGPGVHSAGSARVTYTWQEGRDYPRVRERHRPGVLHETATRDLFRLFGYTAQSAFGARFDASRGVRPPTSLAAEGRRRLPWGRADTVDRLVLARGDDELALAIAMQNHIGTLGRCASRVFARLGDSPVPRRPRRTGAFRLHREGADGRLRSDVAAPRPPRSCALVMRQSGRALRRKCSGGAQPEVRCSRRVHGRRRPAFDDAGSRDIRAGYSNGAGP